MANEKINNYANGDTNFDEIMSTLDTQRYGYHALTLTEFDTTTIPQIAAGSIIEVGGSLFQFTSAETISGSASDGNAYIYMVPTSGTASGATTDATGYATSTTTITLASAGTGTILVGDYVTFAGDTVKYKVTSGDADVSNGGTITIDSPGLLTAIPASATAITVYAGKVVPTWTNTAPTWSDSKQGWYGTGGSAGYRYANYKMTKSGSSYSNKSFLLLDKTTDLIIGENGDVTSGGDFQITGDVTASGFHAYITGDVSVLSHTFGSAKSFYIKKPITGWAHYTISGGSQLFQIYQDGGLRTAYDVSGGFKHYGLQLNPGKYTVTNISGGTFNLYCTGVYGETEIVAADIIEEI